MKNCASFYFITLKVKNKNKKEKEKILEIGERKI